MTMRLSETAGGLAITYSNWLGVVMFGFGAALAVHLARNFSLTANKFGLSMVTLVLVGGGIHFLAFKAMLTPAGGSIYALLRQDDRFEWRHALSVDQEERKGGRGGTSTFLVLHMASGQALDIPVGGLSNTDQGRVANYIRERLQK